MIATRRDEAELNDLLAEVQLAMRDLTDTNYPEFSASAYAQAYRPYLGAVVRTLEWAQGDALSPILGVLTADEETIGHEYIRAMAIVKDERPVPDGLIADEVLAIYRTLSWLKGGTLVHPMEFV